jgi:hypothetical protein
VRSDLFAPTVRYAFILGLLAQMKTVFFLTGQTGPDSKLDKDPRNPENQTHQTETLKETEKMNSWCRSQTGQQYISLWVRIAQWTSSTPGQVKKEDSASKKRLQREDFREERLHLQPVPADKIKDVTTNAYLGHSETRDPVSEPEPIIPVCYRAPRWEQGTTMVQHSSK